MENKELVNELVKVQVLCIRWVERNTHLRCSTHRDMDRILMNGKTVVTYKDAAKNLKSNVEKYCKASDYLIKSVLKLEDDIADSEISALRFGLEPQKKFSDLERKLDSEILKRKFFMINEMVGIKDVAEMLELTETAIKQACQQERLLNTKKIGKSWMVHIPECRSYWNKPDMDDNHLYKDYVY